MSATLCWRRYINVGRYSGVETNDLLDYGGERHASLSDAWDLVYKDVVKTKEPDWNYDL